MSGQRGRTNAAEKLRLLKLLSVLTSPRPPQPQLESLSVIKNVVHMGAHRVRTLCSAAVWGAFLILSLRCTIYNICAVRASALES
eukprot:5840257-Amphidinium_carterae.1